MSHITTIDVQILDLTALKAVCSQLGLEFREGQTTHRYFANKTGLCRHAIGIPGNTTAYEVGVVDHEKAGYALAYDTFSGGKGLEKVIGKNATKLKQAYSTLVTRRQVERKGFRVVETKLPNGTIKLQAIGS